MYGNFSNEATLVVWNSLVNDPKSFEVYAELAHKEPARLPDEIKSFFEERLSTPNPRDTITRDLARTAFRSVRWNEIRNVLQRYAA